MSQSMFESDYLNDEEILDMLVREEGTSQIDVKKSLKKGVVIDAKTGRTVPLEQLFRFGDGLAFKFAKDFYRSENAKSKEAKQFRQRLTDFVRFIDKDFYIHDKDALKKAVDFLETLDDMLLSEGTRLRYLRQMYANVVSDKIKPMVAAAMAKNLFAETMDVCRFLMASAKTDVKPSYIWFLEWINYLQYLGKVEIAAYMKNPSIDDFDYNELTDTVIATFNTIGRNIPKLALLCKAYVDAIRQGGLFGVGNGKELSVKERVSAVRPVVEATKKSIANMHTANAAKKQEIAKASAKVKVGMGRRIVNGVKKMANVKTKGSK